VFEFGLDWQEREKDRKKERKKREKRETERERERERERNRERDGVCLQSSSAFFIFKHEFSEIYKLRKINEMSRCWILWKSKKNKKIWRSNSFCEAIFNLLCEAIISCGLLLI